MTEKLDLKQIEKKLYLACLNDGIVDILFGLVVIGFGIGLFLRFPFIPLLFLIGTIPLWPIIKKSVTQPRIGTVNFSSKRKKKENWKIGGLLFLGIFTLIITTKKIIPTSLFETLKGYPLLDLAFIFSLPLFAGVIFFGQKRMMLYILFLIGLFGPGQNLFRDERYGVVSAGMIILIFGIGIFIHFLKKNPKPSKEVLHADH